LKASKMPPFASSFAPINHQTNGCQCIVIVALMMMIIKNLEGGEREREEVITRKMEVKGASLCALFRVWERKKKASR